jgi:hypothetical protein
VVQVSSTVREYSHRLVRLIQGLKHPRAPAIHQEPVRNSAQEFHTDGKHQVACPGSYAIVNSWETTRYVSPTQGIEFRLLAQPYLLDTKDQQVLISTLDTESGTGFSAVVDDSKLLFQVGLGNGQVHVVETAVLVARWQWFELVVHLNELVLEYNIKYFSHVAEPVPGSITERLPLPRQFVHGNQCLSFGAAIKGSEKPLRTATSFFNGRIESPRIRRSDNGQVLAEFDFALRMDTSDVVDISGNAHHGTLINSPMRAAKGCHWDGSVVDWTRDSSHYKAIHFHEDDLDDAAWTTNFAVKIPTDVRSGAYAIELEATNGSAKDYATFFVRPASTTSAQVAMVMPTFTYLAYANEHMFDQTKSSAMMTPDGEPVKHRSEDLERMIARSDLGLSVYDVHRDGSGCIYSSSRRPILNVRPNYTNWALSRPRELSADLLMIAFLERLGLDYDVITDHCLHFNGAAATSRYRTLITGSHPEYCSGQILDAYSQHARAINRNIMFLGGNGFYWVTSASTKSPHRIEVRKGDQGCRSITIAPGERIHSVDGMQGGLWRSRGRAPNYIFGIGPCAFGTGPGKPFVANESISDHPVFRKVFKDVEPSELIGMEGFGGGASGDEIDRFDTELGSPPNTLLLATSQRHDDTFGLFNEESMWPMVNTLGSNCDKVRSDMTFYETSGGGGVFAVGSINWYSSLGWDDFENNVAVVTQNVLEMFGHCRKGT